MIPTLCYSIRATSSFHPIYSLRYKDYHKTQSHVMHSIDEYAIRHTQCNPQALVFGTYKSQSIERYPSEVWRVKEHESISPVS